MREVFHLMKYKETGEQLSELAPSPLQMHENTLSIFTLMQETNKCTLMKYALSYINIHRHFSIAWFAK